MAGVTSPCKSFMMVAIMLCALCQDSKGYLQPALHNQKPPTGRAFIAQKQRLLALHSKKTVNSQLCHGTVLKLIKSCISDGSEAALEHSASR